MAYMIGTPKNLDSPQAIIVMVVHYLETFAKDKKIMADSTMAELGIIDKSTLVAIAALLETKYLRDEFHAFKGFEEKGIQPETTVRQICEGIQGYLHDLEKNQMRMSLNAVDLAVVILIISELGLAAVTTISPDTTLKGLDFDAASMELLAEIIEKEFRLAAGAVRDKLNFDHSMNDIVEMIGKAKATSPSGELAGTTNVGTGATAPAKT